MPVDTSMYGQLQLPNPPQQAEQAQGLLNGIANNRLLQNQNQQYQAQVRAGQLWQQSGGDPSKFNALLTADPTVAPYAMQASKEGLALNTDQVNNAWLHATKMGEAASTILQKGGKLGLSDLDSSVAGMLGDKDYPQSAKAGLTQDYVGLRSKIAADIAAKNPQNDPDITDRIIRSDVQRLASLSENGRAVLQATYGTPQAYNTGGKTVIASASPLNPTGMTVEGGFTNTLSPSEKVQRQSTYNNEKQQPEAISVGEMYDDTGHVRPGYEKVATGPALGAPEAYGTSGQGSGQMLNEDLQAARAYQDTRPIFEQAISHAKTTKTGLGTEEVAAMRNFLGTMGVMSKDDLDKAGDRQVLDKYLTQIQMMGQGWGGGTDLARATAIKGSPNGTIPNDQLVDLLRYGEGLMAARSARFRALKEQNVGPQQYGAASADWAANVDPRAFVMDKYSPQERAAIVKGMNADDLKKFRQSVKTAHQLGFITVPGQ